MPGISNKDWPASRELNRESNLSGLRQTVQNPVGAQSLMGYGPHRICSVSADIVGVLEKDQSPNGKSASTEHFHDLAQQGRHCRNGDLYPAAHTSLKASFISFHNLAHRAIAKHFPTSLAGLGGGVNCTTAHLCTKKGHKARRREGDKCFSLRFFLSVWLFYGSRHFVQGQDQLWPLVPDIPHGSAYRKPLKSLRWGALGPGDFFCHLRA